MAHPDAECALLAKNPFELLCATILSAQCTDVRVNLVTPALFRAYPTPERLAQAELESVMGLVKTTGFYRNKAKNLIGMALGLVRDHNGQVPKTLEALVALPGVARKTANVVLGVSYGLSYGVVVDTHVLRLASRLGLTNKTRPEAVEQDLMAQLPKQEWVRFSHALIFHGRRVCVARTPRCALCTLASLCPSARLSSPKAPPSPQPRAAPLRAAGGPNSAPRKDRPSRPAKSENARVPGCPKQLS